MLQDLRYAIRGLLRTPGFTAAAVVTLALGIGATTAVFSVFYGVTQRPLPYPNGDRVVRVIQVIPPRGERTEAARAGLSPDQLRDWQSRTLSGVAIVSVDSATLTGLNEPVRLNGARVSPAMFSILGVRPLMGRTFLDAEGRRGTAPSVVLGYSTWVRYFGSDAGILNRAVSLNDRLHQVVGVMPEDFVYPEPGPAATRGNSTGRLEGGPEYWVPFQLAPPAQRPAGGFSLAPAIGLVREGVTIESATAEANSTIPNLPNGQRYTVELVNMRDEAAREIKPILTAFQFGVLFVMLIACVNVTNLFLARAARRRKELAIRVALGARAFQITREAILESMLIAIVAALLGWQIAGWAIASLVALPSGAIPRLYEVRLDGLMLSFTVGVALFSALAVGLVVAFRVLRATPWVWLRQHAGDLAGGVPVFNRGRPSSALIVASITAAVILLTGAALLLNSFVRLVSIDTGFDAENLLSFEIALPASRYSDDVRQLQFLQQLEASLRDLPGSDAVTVAASHPFQIPAIASPLTIPGQGESNEMAAYRTVGPGYFRTLGIPILRGREFSPDDREGQPRVVVVNEAFARRYFGNGDAVGRTLQFRTKDVLTIIGVVGDTRATRLDSNPMVELFYPYLQPPRSGGFLRAVGLIRTGTALEHLMPAVRKTLQTIDPSLAIFNAAPMEQIVAESFALSTLYTITAISFGIVALILAVVGIYGLLAYSVSSRTHELGVQIALGADSGRLIWEVLRDGLVLTAAGVIAGLAGAFVLTRFLQRLLFGIEPQDPATFVVVALLFVAVALLASYVPARRATRIDPIVALRTE